MGMNTPQNGLADLYAWAEQRNDYWVEGVKIDFAEQMLAQMEELGISRTELARRLGTSPAYVTKILRGSTNFTLESMVSIARVLDCELLTHLHRKGSRSVWLEFKSTERSADHAAEAPCYMPDTRNQDSAPVPVYLPESLNCGVA